MKFLLPLAASLGVASLRLARRDRVLKIDEIMVGMALSSFLQNLITFCLNIDKILVWADPEHLPLNLIYILIEN